MSDLITRSLFWKNTLFIQLWIIIFRLISMSLNLIFDFQCATHRTHLKSTINQLKKSYIFTMDVRKIPLANTNIESILYKTYKSFIFVWNLASLQQARVLNRYFFRLKMMRWMNWHVSKYSRLLPVSICIFWDETERGRCWYTHTC